jgi:signal transduction histidine kinase
VAAIEAAQRQLYRAEKMAGVGRLAAGMAHEINNPIGFIHSNLGTARGYLAALNEAGRAIERGDVQAAAASWRQHELGFVLRDFDALLQECESGSRRIAAIVADLKAYSSIDGSPAAPVDVGAALQVVARLARSQFDPCPRIVEEIAPVPPVHGDAGRLGQAFMNVLVNAIKAVAAGGEIRLVAGPADGGARVAVHDDGCGIPADVLPRVFDPFFTTRAPGAGTGLGLTVSRDIVLAHGGRIDIRSAAGGGTSVTLWLPGTA